MRSNPVLQLLALIQTFVQAAASDTLGSLQTSEAKQHLHDLRGEERQRRPLAAAHQDNQRRGAARESGLSRHVQYLGVGGHVVCATT